MANEKNIWWKYRKKYSGVFLRQKMSITEFQCLLNKYRQYFKLYICASANNFMLCFFKTNLLRAKRLKNIRPMQIMRPHIEFPDISWFPEKNIFCAAEIFSYPFYCKIHAWKQVLTIEKCLT